MKSVYLDTSVFFKIFFDESGKEIIDRLILLAKENKVKVVISEWVENESLAAVEKRVSKQLIDDSEAHDTLVAIADFLEESYNNKTITSYPINEDVVLTSRIMIQNVHVNASDALHVHVALTSNCDYFISADRDLCLRMSVLVSLITPIDIHINSDVIKFFKDVDPT